MVSTSLSGFITAGVLSTVLMLGRSTANISNYTELEAQARQALELFGREARMAVAVGTTLSATTVTLSIPASPTNAAYHVTYAFDATAQTFTRTDTITSTPQILVTGVQEIPGQDPFKYFRYVNGNYADTFADPPPNQITVPGGNPVEVKQIEINFIARRSKVTVATASNKVLSARFILRNK
jgi:hypothetical protein